MNGSTHRAMTKDVARIIFQQEDEKAVYEDAETVDIVASYSDFPDRVEDISVAGVGTHIHGRNLASLTHFQVPTTGRKLRGYSWALDWSVGVDLPNVDVQVDPRGWSHIMAGATHQHPLAVLLADLDGKATLAADEIAYPTAASMADWVARHHIPPRWREAAGCVCHWVQDACVWQHAKGWLLRGHSSYEGALDDLYARTWGEGHAAVEAGRHEVDRCADDGPNFIRKLVERTARAAPRPTSQRIALRLAVRHTAAVLEWFSMRERYVKATVIERGEYRSEDD